MPYYWNDNATDENPLYWYDLPEQNVHGYRGPISEEEAYAHQNPPLTPEQVIARNQGHQEERLAIASQAMAPILVSLQLGDATDEETLIAKAWQEYYRALKVVDLTSEAPEWPVVPPL